MESHNANPQSEHIIFRGRIWHVTRNPFHSTTPSACLYSLLDGALVVSSQGRIAAAGDFLEMKRKYPASSLRDFGESLILPGFIDTHLHFPQLDIIGCYGERLLGWLQKFTFPAESRFADKAVAAATASRLISELLANGTTTAAIYSSTHRVATETLFEEADRRGFRAVIGKVSMDRNAPLAILQDPESDALDNQHLIQTWHGRQGRLFCALTPRFAPTCSEALLARLGELKRRFPEVYVQTHYAEQPAEIEWVRQLYPELRDYLAVYERFELLGKRTILGHVIHPEPEALPRVRCSQTAVAHCPTSNLFLGSGLFPLDSVVSEGIAVSMGTDIGGGTSLSMWKTLAEAYKIQQLRGRAVSPVELFYLATLGGAEALSLEKEVGNFESGKKADFQVLEWAGSRLLKPRLQSGESPVDQLFALITLADDRLVRRVFIDGREVLGEG